MPGWRSKSPGRLSCPPLLSVLSWQSQKASPEYKIAKAVIEAKRKQVGPLRPPRCAAPLCRPRCAHCALPTLRCGSPTDPPALPHSLPRPAAPQLDQWAARLAERDRSGAAKKDRSGALVDRESRMLAYHINATRKPLAMDEAEQQVGGWGFGGGGVM